MTKATESAKPQYPFLLANDPVCLIIKATLKPIGDTDRFQPAGFPEVGHVIYDAPRTDGNGNRFKEKVCIVDSPASMANHLEKVCMAGEGSLDLHADIARLPHVICVTDRDFETDGEKLTVKKETPHDAVVVSTFTEGHRLASDYFLDSLMNEKWVEATTKTKKAKEGKEPEKEVVPAHWEGMTFREQLRKDFGIVEVKKDKTYFIPPAKWWDIYKTIFKLDPNSLVHGVMFAKEQIKISRVLTAHLEAFGASRVGRSGVKFDRLGKTTSGQPIFAVDEETAQEIRATFIIDLALLRSYGRGKDGLSDNQKKLLLDLAVWKIKQLLARPFRYRTQCFLGCERITIETEAEVLEVAPPKLEPKPDSDAKTSGSPKNLNEDDSIDAAEAPKLLKDLPPLLANVNITATIEAEFKADNKTRVYYSADQLYKAGKDDSEAAVATEDELDEETEE
jgi:CRISPR-associated protein Csb1